MADDVVLLTVQGPFQEDNVRAFLASYGIITRTRSGAVPQHPFTVDGLGAVTILVAADQADEARELLVQVERGELDLPAEDEPIP